MKLHQFFEARQMKDPTKDSLVSKNGKVIVIDKSKEDDYLKKGWELAEAYPVYKTKDYIDRQDRNLKKTPKEKPKKVTKISDLVKDLSGKSTKLKDFGKGIFKFADDVDYSMPRSKREKEQAKNSATNEFTPDHIHNAMMKRSKKEKSEGLRQQFEPEYSEAKRRLGNELRAKLGMKKKPSLDWKKDKFGNSDKYHQFEDQVKEGTMIGGLIRHEDQTDEEYIDALNLYAEFHKEPRPANEETIQMVSAFLSDDELFDNLNDAEDQGNEDVRDMVDNRLEELGGIDPDLAKQSGAFDGPEYQESTDINDLRKRAGLEEGEERSDVQALMREKCEEWLANVQPGSYLGYEDLESDMYDYARGLTHDDLGSGDDLRNFMDNPGDEAGQVVQDVLASNHRVEIEDLFAEGVESQSKEENQVSAILGKALGKSPEEALRYAPGELFSELESINPELADSIASISRIVYNVKLEEGGYALAQKAADLWHDDNPDKKRDGYWRAGVDVQDNYAEKAGGKKGKYLGKGASEWTTEEKIGEKLRKSTLPKITQATKDDAIDFLQSIKKTDPNAYKKLIKRLKD